MLTESPLIPLHPHVLARRFLASLGVLLRFCAGTIILVTSLATRLEL